MVTPSEDSDTILKGTTKRSVLEVAASWGMPIEERKVSVEEVITGIKNGSITEVFGAGTAATIAHIVKVGFRDEVLELSSVETRTFSNKVKNYLDDLKSGKVEDTLGWILKV